MTGSVVKVAYPDARRLCIGIGVLSPVGGQSLDYVGWTRSIGRWLFRPECAGESVYLAIDAEALLTIARSAEPPISFANAEEAATDFVRAVRRQLARPSGWELTGKGSEEAPPGCLGLLAFQVYAAFRMMEDESWSAGAYWPRVKQLLGERASASIYPKNFDIKIHQYMWRDLLQSWANDSRTGCQGGRRGILMLPPKSIGQGHSHVRLPLSQALLRTEDRRRLPKFFTEAGLVAGETLSAKKLNRLHGGLLGERRDLFTAHACKVFTDHRRAAALEQVCRELSEWDGSYSEREKRAGLTPVRMWCNLHQRRGTLSGGLAYKDEQGLWQRHPDLTLKEVLGPSFVPPPRHSYTPFYTDRTLLVFDTSFGSYIEKRSAGAGDRAIVLAKGSSFNHLVDGLGAVIDDPESALLKSQDLPPPWQLLRINEVRFGPKRPWPWSEMLDRDEVSMHLSGGLKLSHSTWLEGFGPRLELRGERLPEAVWLDSQARLPVLDGLVISPRLGVAGTHSVWFPGASSQKLTFRVAAPRVRHLEPKPWVRKDSDWPEKSRRLDLGADKMTGPVLKGAWPPCAKVVSDLAEGVVTPSPQLTSNIGVGSMPPYLLVKLMVAHRRKVPHLLSSKEVASLQEQTHPLVQAFLRGIREESSI